MFFVFLPICLLLPVSLSLFICLFDYYPVPAIIFAKCLYCYFKIWFCNIIFIFISHHHHLLFHFFIHWGRIRDTEFERHGLPLPVRCMGKPFKISTHYFVPFVLQRVTFCLCLFVCFKSSLATTTGVVACLRLAFDII